MTERGGRAVAELVIAHVARDMEPIQLRENLLGAQEADPTLGISAAYIDLAVLAYTNDRARYHAKLAAQKQGTP